MRVQRRNVGAVLVGALLFVAGCGGGDATEETERLPEPTAPATSAAATTVPATTGPATTVGTTIPDSTIPEATTPATTSAEPIPDGDGSDAGALGALVAAFSRYDAQQPFRVSTVTGQTMRVAPLGVDTVQPADPTRPTTIVEVTPAGEQHFAIDLGPMMSTMASGDPATAALLDTVSLEMWIAGDVLTIDATGYQPVADVNPSFDLGPFTPGIGVIDLGRLGDVGGPELVAAIVGSGVPDPVELGQRLPAALNAVVQDPSDPNVFTATASYADVIEAQGNDVENLARGVAVGIAQALGIDVDELAAFYVRYYRSVQSEVEIVIGADGALETLTVVSDLSTVYDEIFAEDSALDLGGTDAQLAEARDQFAGTEWIVETVSTFAIDPSIVVTPPPGDHEDRTDAALDFFAQLLPA